MKKMIILLLLLFPLKVDAISASAYIVMDTDNNRVIEGSNIHAPYLIASTSKIMTAMVVLNYLDINKVVTIGDEVLQSYGSGIYVEVGEKISVENLLYGLMLRSGNDAAIALAYEVGGSMEGFSTLMNLTAQSIGMKNSNFINSHGLENNNKEGNMSTVYDMGLLSSYAMRSPLYRKLSSTKKMTVKTDKKTYVWHNKNRLLNTYKHCTGGKTGFTELARRTLVTTASKDNMNFTTITFKDGNDFKDHLDLYEKSFKNHQNYLVLNEGPINTKIKNTYLKNDVNVTLTKSEHENLKTNIKYFDNNATNIAGEVEVILNGQVIDRELIYYEDEKPVKISFFKKLLRKLGFNG